MSQTTSELAPEVRSQVIEIIADVLEVSPEELTDESDFVEDHEADSLAIIEIFAKLERDLGVRVPPEELADLNDLNTACALVARHLPAGAVRV
jgi:acyl carrier protein